MTHRVLGDDQGALTADVVFAFGGQIHELHGADSVRVSDNADGVRERALVLRVAGADDRRREVVRLHDGDRGDLEDLTLRDRAVRPVVEVTVDRLLVEDELVVLSGLEDRITASFRNVLLVERLSRSVQSVHESRVGVRDHVCTASDLRATERTRDGRGFARGQDEGLEDVLVEGVGQAVAGLLRVDRADVVVVLRLVDGRDEGRGNEEVIDGDDALAVVDRVAGDLVTGDVVLGADLPGGREGRALAVGDRADKVTTLHDVDLCERGENFTTELLEEQRISIARSVDHTKAGGSGVCHV